MQHLDNIRLNEQYQFKVNETKFQTFLELASREDAMNRETIALVPLRKVTERHISQFFVVYNKCWLKNGINKVVVNVG
jgi:hypothetical protein